VADLAAIEDESDLSVIWKRIAEDRNVLETVASKMDQRHEMMLQRVERMKKGAP
jgi:hypothetical protein